MNFEVIVRQIDNGVLISEKTIHELEVTKPANIIDIGFRHSEQIDIISSIQDSYIPLQCKLLLESTLIEEILSSSLLLENVLFNK